MLGAWRGSSSDPLKPRAGPKTSAFCDNTTIAIGLPRRDAGEVFLPREGSSFDRCSSRGIRQ